MSQRYYTFVILTAFQQYSSVYITQHQEEKSECVHIVIYGDVEIQ